MAKGKAKERWYIYRMDVLSAEGFTPEEYTIIANCRISSSPIKRLRRQRKKELKRLRARGLSGKESIDELRERIRASDDEILTWDDLRKILYPAKSSIFA